MAGGYLSYAFLGIMRLLQAFFLPVFQSELFKYASLVTNEFSFKGIIDEV